MVGGRCDLWPSGRVEALALAPGTGRDIARNKRKRDRVPRGTYERLTAAGVLTTDGARLVPRVPVLMRRALRWRPSIVVCDRFRLGELLDAARGQGADTAAYGALVQLHSGYPGAAAARA